MDKMTMADRTEDATTETTTVASDVPVATAVTDKAQVG